MKKIFEDYFYFTRSEKKGILLLITSSILLCFIPYLYPYLYKEVPTDFTAFQAGIQASPLITKKDTSALTAPELFNFDPNTISQEELIRLGISQKVANTIINYRNKGGQFRAKEDLKKIYGLQEKDYLRLEAYITIKTPKKGKPIRVAESSYNKKSIAPKAITEAPIASAAPKVIRIDINKASAEEWQSLRGIGPVFSKRIVKFRDKLGGFYSIEQVAETYGLPDSTFLSIKSKLLSSTILRTLPINTISEEVLKAHPYLNWKDAKALIKFRKHNGPFKTLADLQQCYALKKETIQRIAPYLQF